MMMMNIRKIKYIFNLGIKPMQVLSYVRFWYNYAVSFFFFILMCNDLTWLKIKLNVRIKLTFNLCVYKYS